MIGCPPFDAGAVQARSTEPVVAPGASILSTLSRAVKKASTDYGISSDKLFYFSGGTSMATPLVAGCVAVLREILRENGTPRPSAALIKALLINGAVELPGQYTPSEAGPSRERALDVTPGFFAMLGVRPRAGRDFLPEDALPGAAPVVLLSHALWRDRFGADPSVMGRSIVVDHVSRTVIGVMPPDIAWPAEPRLFTPLIVEATAAPEARLRRPMPVAALPRHLRPSPACVTGSISTWPEIRTGRRW